MEELSHLYWIMFAFISLSCLVGMQIFYTKYIFSYIFFHLLFNKVLRNSPLFNSQLLYHTWCYVVALDIVCFTIVQYSGIIKVMHACNGYASWWKSTSILRCVYVVAKFDESADTSEAKLWTVTSDPVTIIEN